MRSLAPLAYFPREGGGWGMKAAAMPAQRGVLWRSGARYLQLSRGAARGGARRTVAMIVSLPDSGAVLAPVPRADAECTLSRVVLVARFSWLVASSDPPPP